MIKKVKGFLEDGKKGRAQSAIVSQLDGDRFLPEMKVASSMSDFLALGDALFEADDGDATFLPQEKWDRSYWTSMRVELSNNFSIEKLRHVIEVMEFFRKQKKPDFSPVEESVPPRAEKERIRVPDSDVTIVGAKTPSGKQLMVGGGVGAIAGGLVGGLFRGVLLGGIVGAVVGVGVVYVLNSKKK